MNPDFLFVLLAAISLSYFIFEFWLDELNFKHSLLPLPKNLASLYSNQSQVKSIEYRTQKYKFGKLTSTIGFLTGFVFFILKGYGWLDSWLRGHFENEIVISLLFFLIITLASDFISTPFAYYDQFVIEEKFGFNKTTLKTFFSDKLKSLTLMLLIGGPLMWTLLSFYNNYGQHFWWMAWLLFTLFSLVANVLYVLIIVPLFNKLSPLEEGSLKNKIETYAMQNNFNLKRIMVMDGSKRSSKANAFFTGIGKYKTVVLYDTLIQKLTEEEIVAVLAHEIGHYKKHHIWQTLFLGIISTGISFFVLSQFLGNSNFDKALGGNFETFHLEIIAITMVFSPLNLISNIFTNYLSQKNEYEADAFAAQTFSSEHLCTGLIKLSEDSLSNLNPHPLYVKLNYSHPPLHQRLEALGYWS